VEKKKKIKKIMKSEQTIEQIEDTYETIIFDLETERDALKLHLEKLQNDYDELESAFDDLFQQRSEMVDVLHRLKDEGADVLLKSNLILYVKDTYSEEFGNEWMPIVIDYIVDGDISFDSIPHINVPNDHAVDLVNGNIDYIDNDDYFLCRADVSGHLVTPELKNPYWDEKNPPYFLVSDLEDDEDDDYEIEEE
jgi:hypothetical protein